eukprot:TRINITY_DN16024_c0_g1_i4.p1 TRINITY_DN16024_c0_g1~~TRINITY_DN16024_c0_g1_i4.p1  ORF type:complete len:156 (-),score=33.04 TRINITY_DN16024_c0_g1_i4:92-559(-)
MQRGLVGSEMCIRDRFDIKQYGSEKYLSVNKTEHFIVVQKSERNSTWNLNMVNDSWALQNCNTMTYINMIDSKSTAMNSAVIPSTSFIIKIQQNPLSMKPKQIGKFYNLTNKYVLIKNMKEKYLSIKGKTNVQVCLLYTSPSPRDLSTSRMPSSA